MTSAGPNERMSFTETSSRSGMRFPSADWLRKSEHYGRFLVEPSVDCRAGAARARYMVTDVAAHLERGRSSRYSPRAAASGPFADAMTHAGQQCVLAFKRLVGAVQAL